MLIEGNGYWKRKPKTLYVVFRHLPFGFLSFILKEDWV